MICNINNIYNAFEIMKKNGFETTKELKWGFYFIDGKKDTLRKISSELQKQNYQVEKIRKIGNEEFQLSVSKIDILTPEKLHERNLAFNELADSFSVLCYDGWDVGKINN